MAKLENQIAASPQTLTDTFGSNATAKSLWERVERLLDYLAEMFTLHPSSIKTNKGTLTPSSRRRLLRHHRHFLCRRLRLPLRLLPRRAVVERGHRQTDQKGLSRGILDVFCSCPMVRLVTRGKRGHSEYHAGGTVRTRARSRSWCAALGRQPGEELIDAPIDTARRNRSFAGVISAQGCNWTPVERKVAQIMADTGENRQIIERSNAKEAETVRTSKRVVSEARSTAKASNAAFGATEKGSRRRVKGSGQRSSDPKASKT